MAGQTTETTELPTDVQALVTPGLESAMRALASACDNLRKGMPTQLGLHEDERAALKAHLTETPPTHEPTRDLCHRLLSGDVVQPPADMSEIEAP